MVVKKQDVQQINVILGNVTYIDFDSEEVKQELAKVKQEIDQVLRGMSVDVRKLLLS